MSNPGVLLLDEGRVKNKVVRIEDNLGEAIHIHIDDIRFSFSVDEFNKFCASIDRAVDELFSLEGLDWRMIDKSSLDWPWISEYENIDSFEIKYIKLDEIYTFKPLTKDRSVQKIILLKDSLMVKELESTLDSAIINNFDEKNFYGVSATDRLFAVKNLIEKHGYPYDNKLIMVDNNNRIFDGDHRAACLYFLHGGDYVIPVIQIRWKDHEDLDAIIAKNRKQILIYQIKRKIKKCIVLLNKFLRIPCVLACKLKNYMVKTFHHLQIDGSENSFCDYDTFIDTLNKERIKYYLINRAIINDGVEIAKTLIVDDVLRVKDIFELEYSNIYGNFSFLYSISHPFEINTNFGKILIWDQLCCKSRFEKSILPLDKSINKLMWAVCSDEVLDSDMAIIPEFIYIVANCILEKCSFSHEDQNYVMQHIKLLDNHVLKNLLNGVFFGFSDELISHLRRGAYTECVNRYVLNANY